MTDDEMREAIRVARQVAGRVGPQHSAWDVIADAEAILSGKPSMCPRHTVERALLNIAAAA